MTTLTYGTALDKTYADSVLKELYIGQDLSDLTFKNNKMLATITKKEQFGGRKMPLPIEYALPQGATSDFATAQTGAKPSLFEAWDMDVATVYQCAVIDGKLMRRLRNDREGFIRAAANQINGVLKNLSRNANRNLYRSRAGELAQIGSVGADSTTIVLAVTVDHVLFEVGMVLRAYSSLTGAESGARRDTRYFTITKVDRDTGTLTGTASTAIYASWTANDYLVVQGDYVGTDGDKMTGLANWIPSTHPTTGDSFYGVDRSVDSRLSGTRHDGTSQSTEDALIEGQSEAAVMGGSISQCYVNPKKFRQLVTALGSKVHYNRVPAQTGDGAHATIGFRSISIEGDNETIEVISDRDCPLGLAYMIDPMYWELWSTGPVPEVLGQQEGEGDGLQMLRQAEKDSYEVRMGFDANPAMVFPGANARVALAT
jgi:hypothetical protein